MKALTWHAVLGGMLITLMWGIAAQAAPERLDDIVPDAFPDQPDAVSFGYSHEAIKLEGPLNDESIAHDYFKLRYTFNPKTALSFRYGNHDLSGGYGLSMPLFDGKDNAESFELNLGLNLLNVPATPPDPETGEGFAAGSSFGIGFAGTLYSTSIGDLTRDDTLLKAYLVYTTDLSPEMRAHTIFASGRLAGDDQSGSVNRIGAGLDYTLVGGDRPLVLMANGVLDVYNFREPDFNTSRISRFDIGLRYRVAEDWYASLGYITNNDSENDASGSGLYAGVQFVDEPSPPAEECVEIEPVADEPVTDGGTQPVEPQALVPLMEAPQPAEDAEQRQIAEATPVDEIPEDAGSTTPETIDEPEPAGDAENSAEPASEPESPSDTASEPEIEPETEPETATDQENTADQIATPDTETSADGDLPSVVAIYQQPPLMRTIPEFWPTPTVVDSDSHRTAAANPAAAAAAAANEIYYAPNPAATDQGVVIPPSPVKPPQHTRPGTLFVRAGSGITLPVPHHTRPEDVMVRPPTDPNVTNPTGILSALLLEPASQTTELDTYEGG